MSNDEHRADQQQDIYETPSGTPDFKSELAAQLAELIPEAIADGKVDVEKLKELLGDDAGDDRERFGLFWAGKKRALRAAQEPTTATLKPDVENSKDWDTTKNVFIEGDNLEVLKILQKHYHAKVDVIYIDPPYNTGKDFVYPDNYREGLTTYLEWTRQVNEEGKKVTSNAETAGAYHSNWLNMMYPRLKLARNLLAQDGVIFISIDDNELDNLIKICNEIFGEVNYVSTLAVEMSKTQGMKVAAAQRGQIVKNHEYVLVYSRSAAEVLRDRRPLFDAADRYDSHFDVFLDDDLRPSALVDVLGADPTSKATFNRYGLKVSKANLAILLAIDDDFHSYFLRNFSNRLYAEMLVALDSVQGLDLPQGQVVRHGKYLLRRNSKGTIRQLQPFSASVQVSDDYRPGESRVTIRGALWKGFHSDMMNVGKEGGIEFKNGKKPIRLIRQLIKWANRPEGIVLDFFAGSGTTAEAVVRANAADGGSRRYVLVQLPEPIDENSKVSDITKTRLAGIDVPAALDGEKPDTGFRAYGLSDTNFTKWRVESDVDATALQQHLLDLRESAADDATPDSLLTEILLKQGYSLTEQIGDAEVDGLKLKSVGGGLVLAYLDEHNKPTLEQLRAVLGSEDLAKFIILEDAFKGDDELKTNLVQEAKTRGVELWTA
jgi:adenine-specific DNA-methyltransferase